MKPKRYQKRHLLIHIEIQSITTQYTQKEKHTLKKPKKQFLKQR